MSPLNLLDRAAFDRCAVMLNANAKKVTPRVVDKIARVVPHNDLFLSHSHEQARQQVQTVIERGYPRVLAGGGDGTVVTVSNLFDRALREHARSGQLMDFPELGVLRLGTGNAMASVLGAGRLVDDVRRHLQGRGVQPVQVDMIRAGDEGRLCPFSGIGYDAEVLGDYNWVKQHAQGPLGRWLMQTSLGYLGGLFGRTLPRKLAQWRRPLPQVEIRARGRAFAVDFAHDDRLVELHDPIIYRGPAAFVGAGTVPVFGMGFRVFPFAGRVGGLMQLRVTDVSALTAVANLGKLWRGTWRHPRLHDFLVDDIEVTSDRPLPYQIGGDAAGEQSRLRLRVAAQPLRMTALLRPDRALRAAA